MKKITQLTTAILALSLSSFVFAANLKPLLIINESDSNGHDLKISYKVCEVGDEEAPVCTASKTATIEEGKNLEINLKEGQMALVLTAELQDQDNKTIAQSDYTYVDSSVPDFTDSHCAAYADFALTLGNHGTNRLLCIRAGA